MSVVSIFLTNIGIWLVEKLGAKLFRRLWRKIREKISGKPAHVVSEQPETKLKLPGGLEVTFKGEKASGVFINDGVGRFLVMPIPTPSGLPGVVEAKQLMESGESEKAEEKMRDLLSQPAPAVEEPSEEQAFLAALRLLDEADTKFHADDFAGAEKVYREAHEMGAQSGNELLEGLCIELLGVAIVSQGRHEEALLLFERALALLPDNASTWHNKGTALYKLERYEEAICCYDEAIRLEPGFAVAWNNKGTAIYELQRYEEAIRCYDEAIRLKPGDAEAWSNKGAVLVKLGRNKQASTCLNEAIRVDESWGMAWYNKGLVLVNMGRVDNSVACFDRAIEIDKNNASFWYNKGVSLIILARYEESIICFEKAIEIDGEDAAPWYNKGFSLAKLKKKEEALACFHKATEIDENLADAWYNQAIMLGTLGLDAYRESKRCFKRTFAIRDRLLSNGASLYRAWARLILSHAMVHLLLGNVGTAKNLAKDFDRLKKMAESDSMDQILKDTVKDYKAKLSKGKAKILEDWLRG